ncbi:hypothetical protein GCM10009066_17580 [Halarchaeum salinum]|uniref:Transposase n=1 Tax=Halarchaeum salinum TaxID=489912 RepID=A0AAV3S7F4_9EURY
MALMKGYRSVPQKWDRPAPSRWIGLDFEHGLARRVFKSRIPSVSTARPLALTPKPGSRYFDACDWYVFQQRRQTRAPIESTHRVSRFPQRQRPAVSAVAVMPQPSTSLALARESRGP